jgi:hypothetical protein
VTKDKKKRNDMTNDTSKMRDNITDPMKKDDKKELFDPEMNKDKKDSTEFISL